MIASDGASIWLERVVERLPAGFETIRAEARAENHEFLDRLAIDWEGGVMRFDREGEALFAAHLGESLAGIGGITRDPIMHDALRIRRFYVRTAFRRVGVGQKIAKALLATAHHCVPLITLNAAAGSEPFWEALGFTPEPRDGHTHVRKVCLLRASPSETRG